MISAEQFVEWRAHPVTKEIFKGFKEISDSIKEQLAHGNTIGPDAEFTHASTSRAVGQLDGLNQLLNVHFAGPEDQDVVDEQSGY